LLCSPKAAAQNYGNIRVQRTKLVENRVTVHNGKKKIKDDQANFLADLLVVLSASKPSRASIT